jgi:hypothetical protein
VPGLFAIFLRIASQISDAVGIMWLLVKRSAGMAGKHKYVVLNKVEIEKFGVELGASMLGHAAPQHGS